MKNTRIATLGVGLSLILAACGGDDTNSTPGTGGAGGRAGSTGTAGSGLGGSSGGTGGSIGTAGTISLGGNGGGGGNVGGGGSGGSGGKAGAGGSAIPDASTDTGTGDARSDVSTTSDSGGNVDATDSGSNVDMGVDTGVAVDTGVDTGAAVDSGSDALGPADSGVDVGVVTSCDAGEGLLLKSVPGQNSTGWLDRATNCVGIQGAIYLVKDSVSNVFFTSTTNHFCVSGSAIHSATLDANHWGITVAVQLNNTGTAETPYDATSHGVTGFDFTLAGANVPTSVRAVYRVDGEGTEYCKLTGGAGAKTFLVSEAHPQCYLADAGTAAPNASQLIRLEFQVPSNTTTDVPFDFCVENLTAKKQ